MWKSIASNALTLFIVLLVAAAALVAWGRNEFKKPGPLTQAICVQVDRGASLSAVSRQLAERGAISDPRIFRIGADYSGKASDLKFGSYLIDEGASMEEVLAAVTAGGQSTCGQEVNFRIGVASADVILRELDPATNRFVEVVKFDPAAEALPAEYLAAREDADLRYRVTLAEGVTSWQVVEALKRADFLDGAVGTVGALDAVADQFVGCPHVFGGALGLFAHGVDGAGDFLGGCGGAFGQFAHFVGNDGEAAPLFAGARGFDGGIQCQQIGLVGHLANYLHDVADLGALRLQLLDGLAGLMDQRGNVADVVNGLPDGARTRLGQFDRCAGQLLRLAGAVGNVIDADCHLLHGGGDRRGRFALCDDGARNLPGGLRKLLCAAGDGAGVLGQRAETSLQLAEQAVEGGRGRADFVHAGYRHPRGEIERIADLAESALNAGQPLANRLDDAPGYP